MADASLSNYPESVDSFNRISDLDKDTLKKSNEYKKLINLGRYLEAYNYLNKEENADLKQCAIGAELINKHSDAIVNIENEINKNVNEINNRITDDYLSKTDASRTYLTKNDASNTYLTKNDARDIYLSQTDARDIYLSQNDANNTYLTKNDASSTYAEKSHIHDEFFTNMFNWGDVQMSTLNTNGISCIRNNDGTFVFNGTATKTFYSNKITINKTLSKPALLLGLPGKYCGVRLTIFLTYPNGQSGFTTSTESSVPESGNIYIPSGATVNGVQIGVTANQELNNVKIKPMITYNTNATYNDFIPFTGTTGNINSDIAELRSQFMTALINGSISLE